MSKCSVSKNVYRLLNKNLNFAPTGEVYNNKTQLKYDLNNFFLRMKLKGHFKDNKQTIQMKFKLRKKAHGLRKKTFNWIIYRSSIHEPGTSIRRKAKKTKSNLDKGESDVLKDTMNAYFCYHQTLLDYDFQ